jgi:GDPmannose 4,6-dehydratase
VRIDPRYFRPTEVESLWGDATKAKKQLGWEPKTSFKQLVEEMVQADLAIANRDAIVARKGFKTFKYHE